MSDYKKNWCRTVFASEAYGGTIPSIPEGYESFMFRIPQVGDLYLPAIGGSDAFTCTCSDETHGAPRIILRKKKPRRWIVEEDKNAHLTLFVDNAIFPVHVRVVEEVK